MKPVSDSTSQPLPRSDSVSQRNITSKGVDIHKAANSAVPKEEMHDHLLERALSAVKSHSDIVDHSKVSELRDRIQSGDYPALSNDSSEYWDNLASKMIDAEYDYSK